MEGAWSGRRPTAVARAALGEEAPWHQGRALAGGRASEAPNPPLGRRPDEGWAPPAGDLTSAHTLPGLLPGAGTQRTLHIAGMHPTSSGPTRIWVSATLISTKLLVLPALAEWQLNSSGGRPIAAKQALQRVLTAALVKGALDSLGRIGHGPEDVPLGTPLKPPPGRNWRGIRGDQEPARRRQAMLPVTRRLDPLYQKRVFVCESPHRGWHPALPRVASTLPRVASPTAAHGIPRCRGWHPVLPRVASRTAAGGDPRCRAWQPALPRVVTRIAARGIPH